MYVPTYFTLKEVLPMQFYKDHIHMGKKLWLMFDERLLKAADAIREEYGKMVVNTWAFHGNSQWRGYRPWDCPIGSSISQHKFGRALDMVPVFESPEIIRMDLLSNFLDVDISCVELGVPWLHIDTRNRNGEGVTGFRG